MQLRLTSFATYKDLVGYIKCRDDGHNHPPEFCYNRGDNGVGAWGDVTATTKVAMCAMEPALLAQHYGHSSDARGRKVSVTLNGRTIECEIRDKGPHGVCDLNPGALIALGLDQETELNETGVVEFLD